MARRASWPPRPYPHTASGQERVRWQGKDYYLGPIGSAEARQGYLDLIHRLEGPEGKGRPKEPDRGKSVVEVVAAWRLHSIEKYGPASQEVREYEWALQPLVARFGQGPAAAVDVDALEQVRDDMVTHGLCRNVVNRRVVRIRTCWRWAEKKKHVPKGSWEHLRALEKLGHSAKVRRTKAVKPAEWKDVAKVCRQVDRVVRALVLCQWYTGARPGELFPLRASDLVKEKGGEWTYRPESHKCAWRGIDRVIAFGPRAQAVLRPLLEGLPADSFVFLNQRGNLHTRRTYYRAVARACEATGAKFSPYALRHAARLRVTREMSLDDARAVLGHQSVDTTLNYAKGADAETAARAARKIG